MYLLCVCTVVYFLLCLGGRYVYKDIYKEKNRVHNYLTIVTSTVQCWPSYHNQCFPATESESES
jgi:hypothetical protein